jgi:dolichyl-phosphate-mannose-protein mannosyltransferase
MRLPFLYFPDSVIFDEVHFGKFISAYCCTKAHFFDIHPPHAKLLISAAVSLTSYDGGLSFQNIGLPYADAPIWAFRLIPVIIGSLIPPLVYLIVRLMSGGIIAGIFASSLVLLDNGILIQTGVIALDGMLLLFGLLTLYFAIKSRDTSLRAQFWYSAISGLCAGMTVGSKITGLATFALSFLVLIWSQFQKSDYSTIFKKSAYYLTSFLLVYILGWFIHFSILTEPGYGDKFYKPTGNAIVDTFNMQKVMYKFNAGMNKPHAYASLWSDWPLVKRPIFYWKKNGQEIYFVGNLFIWWSTLFGFFLFFSRYLWEGLRNQPNRLNLTVCLMGYFMTYLPYAAVNRVLFQYHYLPPLIYLILFITISCESRSMFDNNKPIYCRKILYMIPAAVICFIWLSPITYGFEKWEWSYRIFKFFPSWGIK